MINKMIKVFKRKNKHKLSFLPEFASFRKTEQGEYLSNLMLENYKVEKLINESPLNFKKHIFSMINNKDSEMEGYIDETYQRDISVIFKWGHNHDFGDFYLNGVMKDRHINIIASFMNLYDITNQHFNGKSILDIGCWTGGTSLLFCAMGANVLAIEEVNKYANCVNYLKNVFSIDRLKVENLSLYALDTPEYYDRFDIVFYSGVLYHVSDPIISLRTIFNSMKNNSICLLESLISIEEGSVCEYRGASKNYYKDDKNFRMGWNWFVPTLEAIENMMRDVGFEIIKSTRHLENRGLIMAKRNNHRDMLRAGLSKPNIK